METRRNPTTRQRAVLWSMTRHYRKHGAPPSQSEVARELGLHASTAHQHILALEEKGWLRRNPPGGQHNVYLTTPLIDELRHADTSAE